MKEKLIEELRKFEMIYDKDDVILFNSRQLYKKNKDEVEREKGIMSNLYTSDFKIPFDGKEFHSSEQLLFYLNIVIWAKVVGISNKEINDRINYLMSCKNGFEVKNTPKSHYFYENVVNKKKKLIGIYNAALDGWKNQYFILSMKYKYCEEFRNVLDKYKDKVWCENSDWGDTFSGVLWDETIGKYRGINCVGRAMRLVYCERDKIMGGDFRPPILNQLITIPIRKYRNVIFDFDGTLLDTRPLEQHFHLFKKYHRFSNDNQLGRKEFLNHINECKTYDGYNEVFDYLLSNNVNRYILTAGSKDKVMKYISDFKLKDVFNPNNIISSYSINRYKRTTKKDGNPTLFNYLLEKYHLNPSECIAFGNEITDQAAANNAHITAYNCLWGATVDEASKMRSLANTIETPKQIIELLN